MRQLLWLAGFRWQTSFASDVEARAICPTLALYLPLVPVEVEVVAEAAEAEHFLLQLQRREACKVRLYVMDCLVKFCLILEHLILSYHDISA